MKTTRKSGKKAASVVVIGAGAIGQAIAHELSLAKTRYELWDIDAKKVPGQKPLEAMLPQAEAVFFCVPSWVLRSAIESVLPHVSARTLIVTLSKGVEAKTNLTIDLLLRTLLPEKQPFVLLSGPMLADEMSQGLGACALIATEARADFLRCQKLFHGSMLELTWNSDVHGVAIASVLKNVYSIALGIVDGLGWGGNKKGWIAACALAEMQRVLVQQHASEDILFSPAASGDFLATGYSQYSRNRRVGDELVKTGMCCIQSEGLVSFASFKNMLGCRRGQFALMDALEAVLIRHADPRKTFDRYYHDSFITRSSRS